MKNQKTLSQLLLLNTVMIVTSVAYAACNSATIAAQAPESRYTYMAGGAEVLDTQTALVWQRCAVGQVFDGNATSTVFSDDSCTGSVTIQNWQEAVESATGSWRLPNIKALASLVAAECSGPALNDTVFPNASAQWVWSASPDTANPSKAWVVDFSSGEVEPQAKTAKLTSSRLVKNQ